VNVVGSALTLVLSLAAVPRLGFVGAALATLIASTVSQAILLALSSMREDVASCLRPLPGPVALAIALVAAGITIGGSSVIAACAALVVFALALVASGAVGASDWALVRRAFGRTATG
jgi:O-antigen/teichoic acid export membrane protein